MSANLDIIARVQIGDAADSITESVTTSVQTFSLPENLRGRVLQFKAIGGDCYFSASKDGKKAAGDPSATEGVSVADGTYREFFIPDGRNDYEYKVLGSGACTLQIDVVSP